MFCEKDKWEMESVQQSTQCSSGNQNEISGITFEFWLPRIQTFTHWNLDGGTQANHKTLWSKLQSCAGALSCWMPHGPWRWLLLSSACITRSAVLMTEWNKHCGTVRCSGNDQLHQICLLCEHHFSQPPLLTVTWTCPQHGMTQSLLLFFEFNHCPIGEHFNWSASKREFIHFSQWMEMSQWLDWSC